MTSTVTLESLSVQIDDSIQYPDILTLESLSVQIDDSIQYPDILTVESLSIQLYASDYSVVNIPQYRNCYLMKLKGGVYVSDCELNINPNNDLEIQTLLDTYSGFVGRKTFTARQLIDLAAASAGEIVLVFIESIESGVSVFDMNTNLAKIETNTGKTIWSCEIIN